MREHALNPKQRRRFVATTDSDHNYPIFPNLAKNIELDGPNQLWGPGFNCLLRICLFGLILPLPLARHRLLRAT